MRWARLRRCCRRPRRRPRSQRVRPRHSKHACVNHCSALCPSSHSQAPGRAGHRRRNAAPVSLNPRSELLSRLPISLSCSAGGVCVLLVDSCQVVPVSCRGRAIGTDWDDDDAFGKGAERPPADCSAAASLRGSRPGKRASACMGPGRLLQLAPSSQRPCLAYELLNRLIRSAGAESPPSKGWRLCMHTGARLGHPQIGSQVHARSQLHEQGPPGVAAWQPRTGRPDPFLSSFR